MRIRQCLERERFTLPADTSFDDLRKAWQMSFEPSELIENHFHGWAPGLG